MRHVISGFRANENAKLTSNVPVRGLVPEQDAIRFAVMCLVDPIPINSRSDVCRFLSDGHCKNTLTAMYWQCSSGAGSRYGKRSG
jgi:hypothetical protein